MTNMILTVLLINVMISYLFHIEVLPNLYNDLLSRIFHRKTHIVKPFSCASCSVFWVVLIYICTLGFYKIAFPIALLSHFLQMYIYNCITLIESLLDKIFQWVFKHLI